MDPCDILNNIHVNFHEKSISNMLNQRFYLSDWWAGLLSTDVSGRGLKILTIIKGL
jgi:hypothetical protein